MRTRKKVCLGCGAVLVLLASGVAIFLFLLLHRTPGQYFDSNGVQIYYTDEGQGEPILLIHGLAANADLNWRRPGITRDLAKEFRVITFDLRGHGLSGQPTEPDAYGIELVEDAVRLMDYLRIEKTHVAGYSLGGFIALKMMAKYPQRIESAAICSSGWIDPANPIEIPNPYMPPPQANAKQTLDASFNLFTGKDSAFHSIKNFIGDRMVNKAAIKAMKIKFSELGVTRAELEANKIPAICFVGTRDGFLQIAKELAARTANLSLTILDGANHFTTPLYGKFRRGLHEFFHKNSVFNKPIEKNAGAPVPLKLLTWNVQMLPARLGRIVAPLRKMQHERAPWIVDQLKNGDYDIVCLQEMFDKRAMAAFLKGLRIKYPYVVMPQYYSKWRSPLSNGVIFMSRVPIRYVGHVTFPEVKGVERLTSKGACLIEGRKKGLPFQVAGTHFPTGKTRYKEAAIREIGDKLLKPHLQDRVPQILAGDFNVNSGSGEFLLLTATTNMAEVPPKDPRPYSVDDANSWRANRKNALIDHVLLNPNGSNTSVAGETIQRAKHEFKGKTIDLSDHYGIAAEILLNQ